MAIKLHVFPPSPRAFKVLLVAHHLEIPYELCLLNMPAGAHRQPEFARLNPNMRMPVLEEDGFALWESNAIAGYLAQKKQGGGLLPNELQARFSVVKWLFWESAHWDPACAIFVFEHIVKGMQRLPAGEPNPNELQRGTELFKRAAGVLNGELEKHRYVAGETLSLADLVIGSTMLYSEQAHYPLESYRAIQRWEADVKALPAWTKTAALLPK